MFWTQRNQTDAGVVCCPRFYFEGVIEWLSVSFRVRRLLPSNRAPPRDPRAPPPSKPRFLAMVTAVFVEPGSTVIQESECARFPAVVVINAAKTIVWNPSTGV